MAQNPLQKFFRQPKIYIKLPSLGVYNRPGVVQGDAGSMPIYGMTGMDEIVMKTPDAMLSGESTVKVIESCCPNIKDAWDLSSLDLDAVLTAIRIATYGSTTQMKHTCSKCGSDNAYDVDLGFIVEHYKSCQYDNKIVLKDLVIKTQPLNYRQNTDFSLRNFKIQQQLAQANTIENEAEQKEFISSLFTELSKIQLEIFTESIESVEAGGGIVTEKAFINEWLQNCDRDVFESIKQKFSESKQAWQIPEYRVQCEGCGAENTISIDMDHSNFFATA